MSKKLSDLVYDITDCIISTDNPDQFFANPERYLIYGNLTAISDLFVLSEGYKTWREENCEK